MQNEKNKAYGGCVRSIRYMAEQICVYIPDNILIEMRRSKRTDFLPSNIVLIKTHYNKLPSIN